MGNSKHKREAAAAHNARYEQEQREAALAHHKREVRCLFDYIALLAGAKRVVRPARRGGRKTALLLGSLAATAALGGAHETLIQAHHPVRLPNGKRRG